MWCCTMPMCRRRRCWTKTHDADEATALTLMVAVVLLLFLLPPPLRAPAPSAPAAYLPASPLLPSCSLCLLLFSPLSPCPLPPAAPCPPPLWAEWTKFEEGIILGSFFYGYIFTQVGQCDAIAKSYSTRAGQSGLSTSSPRSSAQPSLGAFLLHTRAALHHPTAACASSSSPCCGMFPPAPPG